MKKLALSILFLPLALLAGTQYSDTNIANMFIGNGSGLTNANGNPYIDAVTATNIAAAATNGLGNLSRSNRLAYALLDGAPTIPTTNSVVQTNDTRSLNLTNSANMFGGTFSGNGSGLTNLSAAQIAGLPTTNLTSQYESVLDMYCYGAAGLSGFANNMNNPFVGVSLTSCVGYLSVNGTPRWHSCISARSLDLTKTNFAFVVAICFTNNMVITNFYSGFISGVAQNMVFTCNNSTSRVLTLNTNDPMSLPVGTGGTWMQWQTNFASIPPNVMTNLISINAGTWFYYNSGAFVVPSSLIYRF